MKTKLQMIQLILDTLLDNPVPYQLTQLKNGKWIGGSHEYGVYIKEIKRYEEWIKNMENFEEQSSCLSC
mgnify:CR=1 FL=1